MGEYIDDANDESNINDIPLEMEYFKGSLLEYLQRNGYDTEFPNYLSNEANMLSNMFSCRVEQLKKSIIDSAVTNSSITAQKATCIIMMQNVLLSIFASQLKNFRSN